MLTLAADVTRGDVVQSDDLQVVLVASDDPVATMDPDGLSGVVGQVAVTDLRRDGGGAGVLIDREVVAAGEGVVGWRWRRVKW